MIKIIYITNTFEPKKGREITEHEWSGKKLYEYIPPYLNEPTVALNQLHIKDFDVVVPDNSEIIIAPKQEASAIASWVGGFLYGAFAGGVATAGTAMVISAASYAIGTAVMMAGSMLLSSVLAPSSQTSNGATQSINESPTYSWSPAQTLPRVGSSIPVLYGKHQLAGNVIQRRIEYVGDDEYLYLQLALCMGEIEDINDGDILINNTLLAEYEDVDYHFTNGNTSQDVMPYFGDIETPNSFLVELTNTEVTRQTIGNASEALRLFIQFPNGIYYQNDKGGLDSRSVEFKIEYKLKAATVWTTLQQEDSRFSYWEYENRTKVWHDGENESYWTCSGSTYWSTSKEACYTGKRRAVYKTSLFDTWIFSGAKTTPINKEIRIDNLVADEYEVRITRLTAVSTDPRVSTKSNWVGIGEIIKDDLSYPTVSLLGFRIKATSQLSGDVNVLTLCERKDIEVFDEDGVSQGFKRLDNPAWIYWDVLANSSYGYGLDCSQIDYASIEEWALWCDELVNNGIVDWSEQRAIFNGVFDYEGNLWDSLTKICTIGRASPIIKGTKYSVVVDKPSPMVQIFNMGNIKKSSLKISYIGEEELANEVEIQFVNKDKDYTNDTISVVVPEWFDDNQIKKSTIQQMGITNLSQAYRAGRYFLNCNKHIKRTAEFEVGIDAIDSEVGDVIGISHDVPAWGESGRLVSATSNSVKIDKEVNLIDGESYELTVRLEDNTFEKFDIVFTGTQSTDNLTINGTFTTIPSQYDVYSLIEKPHAIKLFRINSITRKTDQTRKIVAVEYNESVVNDSTTIVEIPSTSELTASINDFTVSEHLEKRFDGTIIPFLDFSWDVASDFLDKATLSLYQDGLFVKHLVSDLQDNSYTHNAIDLEEEREYEFRLSIKDNLFATNDKKEIKYTLLGQSSPPPAPSKFFVDYQSGRDIKLSWEMDKPIDHKGYELRIGHSRDWVLSTPIATTIEEQISHKLPSSKSLIILLKSIDLRGNLSLETRSIVVNLGDTIIDNLVYTRIADFDTDTHNGFLHVEGSYETIDENLMYSNDDSDYLYGENNEDEFYKFLFGEASIVSKFTPDTTGQIVPIFDGIGKPIYFIRKYFSKQMYPSLNETIWQDDNAFMWEEDEWTPFITFDIQAYETHEMKTKFLGSPDKSIVNEVKYIIDAPDILEYFDDVIITSSGLHVKPTKPMNSIKNVGVTIQDDGGSAVSVKVLSKDIDEGALIKVFDVNNQATSGTVDITMKGY